ncbi:MAG: AlwI family type II restriction endonuclease [Bacilli bacterium]|nr:AlwI family type II restriction endonuclease [Bacilli bacterium]
MAKLWSFSTTLRSPERIMDFLKIFKIIENKKWDKESQMNFQILLIKHRKYKPEIRGLSDKNISVLEDVSHEMTFQEAKEIFVEKNYQDPPMRGRTSFSPLKELGLAYIDDKNNIKISSLGNMLLNEKLSFEFFFMMWALKWQYPNPITSSFNEGYNIAPLIGTIKLILLVNQKWSEMGNKPVGISKNEFSIFALSLININDIEKWADKLIKYRIQNQSIPVKDKQSFYSSYIEANLSEYTNASIKNIKDYSDNVIRYFSLTNLIKKRGNGYYVDVASSRMNLILQLLDVCDAKAKCFDSQIKYIEYLNDLNVPNIENFTDEIRINYISEISNLIDKNNLSLDINFKDLNIQELTIFRKKLLFKLEKNNYDNIESISNLIGDLEHFRDLDIPPSLALEKLVSSALIALNDALEIKPNYSSDDDNNILFTAGAGKPDIECYYEEFNFICEVTALVSRNQWFNEGQPVMRHLKEFIEERNEIKTYCLFIAPKIHQDTLNTYWYAVKYEYEGMKMNIIPLSLKRFLEIIYAFKKIKQNGLSFKRKDLLELFDKICDVEKITSSTDWWRHINQTFEEWKKSLLNF